MNRSGASGVMVMVTGEEGGIQRVTALGLIALKQQVGEKGVSYTQQVSGPGMSADI